MQVHARGSTYQTARQCATSQHGRCASTNANQSALGLLLRNAAKPIYPMQMEGSNQCSCQPKGHNTATWPHTLMEHAALLTNTTSLCSHCTDRHKPICPTTALGSRAKVAAVAGLTALGWAAERRNKTRTSAAGAPALIQAVDVVRVLHQRLEIYACNPYNLAAKPCNWTWADDARGRGCAKHRISPFHTTNDIRQSPT